METVQEHFMDLPDPPGLQQQFLFINTFDLDSSEKMTFNLSEQKRLLPHFQPMLVCAILLIFLKKSAGYDLISHPE